MSTTSHISLFSCHRQGLMGCVVKISGSITGLLKNQHGSHASPAKTVRPCCRQRFIIAPATVLVCLPSALRSSPVRNSGWGRNREGGRKIKKKSSATPLNVSPGHRRLNQDTLSHSDSLQPEPLRDIIPCSSCIFTPSYLAFVKMHFLHSLIRS